MASQSSITALNMQLEELKDKRAKTEKAYDAAKRSYTIGLVAVLVGVPLLFAYGFGLLFIVAGILAAITQAAKRGKLSKEMADLDRQISTVRQQIAATA